MREIGDPSFLQHYTSQRNERNILSWKLTDAESLGWTEDSTEVAAVNVCM